MTTTTAPHAWPTSIERRAAAVAPSEGRMMIALRGAFYLSWALVATVVLAIMIYVAVLVYSASGGVEAIVEGLRSAPHTSAPAEPGSVQPTR